MRVGVVDVGTNSTRLMVADVGPDGTVEVVDRRSQVTRLGEGLERAGVLSDAAIARVVDALRGYRDVMDELEVERTTGVLTSAVRDAANGGDLLRAIVDDLRIDARTITGDEEARLTYLGAVSASPSQETTVVFDIGGGSSEIVVGRGTELLFHVSTQVGVVRHSERHLHADPTRPDEIAALREDVASIFGVGGFGFGSDVRRAIAVAGTATSCAAMLLALEPYDPDAVEGYPLERDALENLLVTTAAMTAQERRAIPGLHPDRSVTIVAGIAILLEAMRAFDLPSVLTSEHDILIGAAQAVAFTT